MHILAAFLLIGVASILILYSYYIYVIKSLAPPQVYFHSIKHILTYYRLPEEIQESEKMAKYQCCSNEFSSKKALNKHRKTHHHEPTPIFKYGFIFRLQHNML